MCVCVCVFIKKKKNNKNLLAINMIWLWGKQKKREVKEAPFVTLTKHFFELVGMKVSLE